MNRLGIQVFDTPIENRRVLHAVLNSLEAIMNKQKHPEPTGQAKLTRDYNLPSSFVIHSVGPIVQGNLQSNHINDLKNTYKSCMNIAGELKQINQIAFCGVSTGVFGYPVQHTAQTALSVAEKNIVLLELGAGFNTPGVIRLPMESLAHQHPNASLIRANLDHPEVPITAQENGVSISIDLADFIHQLNS